MIKDKKIALEEVNKLLNVLKQDYKNASSKSSKSKDSKKSKRKVNFQGKDEDTKNGGSSIKAGLLLAQQLVMVAVAGVFEFRAIVLFGFTAVAIAKYGDLASV